MFFKRHESAGVVPHSAAPERTDATPIHIEAVHEDPPEFKRIYSADVLRGIHVTITIHRYLGMVMKSGELTQPGGRWVSFDPDAVADKIIDPVLLPAIQAVVDAVLASDAEFRRNVPDQYVDADDATWQRVQHSNRMTG